MNREKDGGKAIASGGFGCVLRPAMKCDGEKSRVPNAISKILIKRYGIEEMDEIKQVKQLVKNIPNYDKYFAVTNYKLCKPGNLNSEDKINFNSKCVRPLGVKADKFNSVKDNFRLIISPDLGIDLSSTFQLIFSQVSDDNIFKYLAKMTRTCMNTLENGVAKLQAEGFYHSDLKPQNLMTNFDPKDLDKSFEYVKVIDFGLARPKDATDKDINTAFLFNAPYTTLLWSRHFGNIIEYNLIDELDFILQDKYFKDRWAKLTTHQEHADFLLNLINTHIKSRVNYIFKSNIHHSGFIKRIYNDIIVKHKIDKNKSIETVISKYLEEAIRTNIKFNKEYTSVSVDYSKIWNSTLKYNLDIYGFNTTFLLLANECAITKNPLGKKALKYLIPFIQNYFYKPTFADKKFSIRDLMQSLKNIENMFLYEDTQINKLSNSAKPQMTRKKILKVKSSANDRFISISLTGKRCPNGYRRDKTRKNRCIQKLRVDDGLISLKGKRCPNGYRKFVTSSGTIKCKSKN